MTANFVEFAQLGFFLLFFLLNSSLEARPMGCVLGSKQLPSFLSLVTLMQD